MFGVIHGFKSKVLGPARTTFFESCDDSVQYTLSVYSHMVGLVTFAMKQCQGSRAHSETLYHGAQDFRVATLNPEPQYQLSTAIPKLTSSIV